MVNGNHFQFDRKSLFNFWKPINRFLKLNSSFLHVYLWEVVIVGYWSLLVTRLYRQKSLSFSIQLPECRQNPVTAVERCRILTTVPGFCFTLLVFFCASQMLKNIFKKIIFFSEKLFR
jgi:hypothetical protein